MSILADAEPDALLRIAALVRALNQTTEQLVQRRRADSVMTVDILLANCTEHAADMLCRKLMQLTCVINAKWRRARRYRPTG